MKAHLKEYCGLNTWVL